MGGSEPVDWSLDNCLLYFTMRTFVWGVYPRVKDAWMEVVASQRHPNVRRQDRNAQIPAQVFSSYFNFLQYVG